MYMSVTLISDKEKADILRTISQQETVEVDRRLTWMCQLQGFLFAALSFAWDKAKGEPFILFLISTLGLAAAALVFKSLLCISRTEHHNRTDWQTVDPNHRFGYHPDAEKSPNYKSPQNIIPLLFIIGWLLVLCYRALCFHCYVFFIVIIIFTGMFFCREICIARKYHRNDHAA
jgi:hypothetical protein